MTFKKYQVQNRTELNLEKVYYLEKIVSIKTAFTCKKLRYLITYLISQQW